VAAGFIFWLVFGLRIFENWAYLPYRINPIAFAVGPIQVHWYGLMYVAAFLTTYGLILRRLRTERWDISDETIADFFNWAIIGVLLGGRLGYVLFYKPIYFFA